VPKETGVIPRVIMAVRKSVYLLVTEVMRLSLLTMALWMMLWLSGKAIVTLYRVDWLRGEVKAEHSYDTHHQPHSRRHSLGTAFPGVMTAAVKEPG